MAKHLRTWINKLGKSLGLKKTPQAADTKKRSRPALELLEDRTAPANFGTVQGIAFLDSNNTNILDGKDARLPGVKVALIGTTTGAGDNTSIIVKAVTNKFGAYNFTNVPEGTYKLVTGVVPGVTKGASQTFTGVSITTNGQIFVHNFMYKGGLTSRSLSMRQLLTNATAASFPFAASGAGTAVGDNIPTSTPLAAVSTTSASNPTVLSLAGNFKDKDITNSLVTFHITNGTTTHLIKMVLFDTATPRTVANFLDYVINNRYDDSVFHRNAKVTAGGIGVLQGGSMTVDATGKFLTDVPIIPIGSKVLNEFLASNSNLAGTIAMAQSPGDINSATNQFFFNTTNNAAALNPQKFTVFGKVADAASMTALTLLAATPTKDLTGGAFAAAHLTSLVNAMPMNNYSGTSASFPNDAVLENYMRITDISIEKRSEFLTYTVSASSNPLIATATITNEYLVIDPNSAGTATFTITATDRYGATATSTVTVNVTGNTAPTAVDGALTTTEDAAQNSNLVGSDSDAGQTIIFVIETPPSKGTVNITNTATGAYTFSPGGAFQNLQDGQNETVTFTFKVTDNLGVSSLVKTVTVTVNGVNDAPVGNDDTGTTDQNTILSDTLTATDVDTGDTIDLFEVVTSPTAGVVSFIDAAAGTFTFDPNNAFDSLAEGENTTVPFTFRARDNHGLFGAQATYTVTVTGVNDAPVANDGILSVNSNAVQSGTLIGTDVDNGDDVDFSIVSQPAQGIVTLDEETGAYTFNPNGAFNTTSGTVTFTFKVTDELGAESVIGTITVNVTAVPIVTSVTITPDNVGDVTVLTATPTAAPVDGNTVTFTYQWEQNGIPIAGATIQSLDLTTLTVAVNDTFAVRVTPIAGAVTGPEFLSDPVTVLTADPNPITLA